MSKIPTREACSACHGYPLCTCAPVRVVQVAGCCPHCGDECAGTLSAQAGFLLVPHVPGDAECMARVKKQRDGFAAGFWASVRSEAELIALDDASPDKPARVQGGRHVARQVRSRARCRKGAEPMKMSPEIAKDLCIRALRQSMGDDLERARSAFRGLAPEKMAEQYGQSGKTRQQILDEHEADRAEREYALGWLKSR